MTTRTSSAGHYHGHFKPYAADVFARAWQWFEETVGVIDRDPGASDPSMAEFTAMHVVEADT